MREQMTKRRPFRARCLVEVDRSLLDCDEHCDARQQLRDRGPRQRGITRTLRADLGTGAGHPGRGGARSPLVDRPERVHGGRY